MEKWYSWKIKRDCYKLREELKQNMKTLLQSKTVWFGLAQMLFGAIGFLTGWIDSTTATTLIFTGLGTIGFRTQTSAPIVGFSK